MSIDRDNQMFELMDADQVGYQKGISEERHRVAEFLGVTLEHIDGINLVDQDKRLDSLKAIVAGTQLKIEEIEKTNG